MVNLRQYKDVIIFDTAVLTATSVPINTRAYRNIIITVKMDAAYAGTYKFYGSAESTDPDYTSAISLTNGYAGIQAKDRQDDSAINGDTGETITAGSARTFMYEYNSNLLTSIGVVMTRSAGTVTISLQGTTNA